MAADESSFTFRAASGELACSVLPTTVLLGTIAKENVKASLGWLIELLLLPGEDGELLSFTQTEDEASLLVSQAVQRSLAAETELIRWSPLAYRVIRIVEGEEALDAVGIISSIALSLAAAELDILYLSTYTSDLILVPEGQLPRALAQLARDGGDGEPPWWESDVKDGSVTERLLMGKDASAPLTGVPLLDLTAVASSVCIATLPSDAVRACAFQLLRALFYSAASGSDAASGSSGELPFASFTRDSHGASSLILQAEAMALLAADVAGFHALAVHDRHWAALRVSKGAVPAAESAVVAALAWQMAEAAVPTYYVSTSMVDLLLLSREHSGAAVESLAEMAAVQLDGEHAVALKSGDAAV
eukprot:PLAT4587.1.p1 GENE.PLAT4587.1~~PLAT4587.1.p1  ORF type:complete len:379 (+),score=144.88 PLAT4587.1:57-1139(+)